MIRYLFILFLIIQGVHSEASRVDFDTLLMGSAFSFTAIHQDESVARKAVRAGVDEVIRIEKLISSWDPESETSHINSKAGFAPVKVSNEFLALIFRCTKISGITGGAFDITYAALDPLWKFDGSNNIPDSAIVKRRLDLVSYHNIIIDQEASTVFLKKKGMKIGFGAIGKGFAANRAKVVLTQMGISAGVVNAGGDIMAWGNKEDNSPWDIGLLDPLAKDRMKSIIQAEDISVVTSGNYEKYFEIGGVRYSHIINPRTGWPTKGISSVTIISSNAELGDAFATAIFVMGKEEGLALANKLQGVSAIIITEENEQFVTNDLKKYYPSK